MLNLYLYSNGKGTEKAIILLSLGSSHCFYVFVDRLVSKDTYHT